MNNAFEVYEQLRKQQVHYNKIINPQIRVPKHGAYKPIKAKIEQTRLNQRMRKDMSIQRQNMHIMKKLFSINKRKPQMKMSNSTPSFSLPPIILKKKPFIIPQHEAENNLIAQKLISSKSYINVRSQMRDFNQKQKIKQNLSKYHSVGGYEGVQIIDRKRYIAQLMMLKKIKLSEQTQSRLKEYISGVGNSRISKYNAERTINNPEKAYYSNK